MRDLINIINEATGLAGRGPGDIFIDDNGNEVMFREDSIPKKKWLLLLQISANNYKDPA